MKKLLMKELKMKLLKLLNKKVKWARKKRRDKKINLHQEMSCFLANPPLLSHHYRFCKDLGKLSWMSICHIF